MDRIVVFAFQMNTYLTTAFHDGRTPIDHLQERLISFGSIDGFEPVPLVFSAGLSQDDQDRLRHECQGRGWEFCSTETDGVAASFQYLDQTIDVEAEQLILLRLDAPFVDFDVSKKLIDLQKRSWSDYSFADGYPTGYAAEVIRRDLLPILVTLSQTDEDTWRPGVVFDTLKKDINAFDVETIASPEDYAILRTSFTVDNRQNYLFCRRLIETGKDVGSYLSVLLESPEIRRTLPHYYQVQITTEMVQRPSYTPWAQQQWAPDSPSQGTHMPLSVWRDIIQKIAKETPSAIVAIGYRGEPALHPNLNDLIQEIARFPGLSLYVETSGIGWSDTTRASLRSPAVAAVIVEVDSIVPETYCTIRNGETRDLEEVKAFVELLRSEIPRRIYVQATRMTDNEWELPDFYRYWNEKGDLSVIIQKHNSFAGRIPDRKVADLTPLKRMPCRHLERDMVVLVDGTVPRCFQDIDREVIYGSLLTNSIEDVWKVGAEDFSRHLNEDYPQICTKCDEYYTFNA